MLARMTAQAVRGRPRTAKQLLLAARQEEASRWGLRGRPTLMAIKERNKPILPKKELPKAPFFLYDLSKVLNEDNKEDGLLKEEFFSTN